MNLYLLLLSFVIYLILNPQVLYIMIYHISLLYLSIIFIIVCYLLLFDDALSSILLSDPRRLIHSIHSIYHYNLLFILTLLHPSINHPTI